jgi:threonine/homoserine/homoserine lactone efflux protein
VVEFPLMFLIYYGITQFLASNVAQTVQITVGLIGGVLMMYMGIQTFRNRKKTEEKHETPKRDSFIAGIWTTAANAGFILWWITIGTALIMTAKSFGLLEFSVFAIVHWLCDFVWYTVIAVIIFKSRRFWTQKVHEAIVIFCFAVLLGFGAWFFSSALWSAISTFA